MLLSFKKNKNKKDARPLLALILIIFLQTCLIFYYGQQKQAYHLDEIFSLTQANGSLTSARFTSDKTLFNKWLPGCYFHNLLTVQPHERFNYSSAYISQKNGSHPPLFHITLNTVYSFFPEMFSKWPAIGLNIFWSILTCLMLYAAACFILPKSLALIPVALYSFSSAALSNVMFMRMYMFLSFSCIALVYLSFKIIFEKKTAKSPFIWLFLITFLGCLTHYYFLIWAALVMGFIFLFFLISKQYRKALVSASSVLTGLLASILCFPSMLSHAFQGSHSKQIIFNLTRWDDFETRLRFFYNALNQSLVGGLLTWFLFFSIGCLFFVSLKKNKKTIKGTSCLFILLLTIPSVLYFLIVSKIAPFMEIRYLTPLFPALSLLFPILFHTWLPLGRYNNICFILVFTGVFVNNICHLKPDYLYQNEPDTVAFSEKYRGTQHIVVNSDPFLPNYIVPYLSESKEAFLHNMRANHPANHLKVALNHLDPTQKALLYISTHQTQARNSVIKNPMTIIRLAEFETGGRTPLYLFTINCYDVYELPVQEGK